MEKRLAGVVPCGGRKKSPRTSSIVQIIFLFRSFENSVQIFRVFKTFKCKQCLNYLTPFRNVSSRENFRNYSTIVWLSSPVLKGLLMRVHYPKLRNIVHTISL